MGLKTAGLIVGIFLLIGIAFFLINSNTGFLGLNLNNSNSSSEKNSYAEQDSVVNEAEKQRLAEQLNKEMDWSAYPIELTEAEKQSYAESLAEYALQDELIFDENTGRWNAPINIGIEPRLTSEQALAVLNQTLNENPVLKAEINEREYSILVNQVVNITGITKKGVLAYIAGFAEPELTEAEKMTLEKEKDELEKGRIIYRGNNYTITVNGQTYTADQLGAMSEEERNQILDEYRRKQGFE